MLRASAVMIVNKRDLPPYVRSDVERCIANARIYPAIREFCVSAQSGQGTQALYAYLHQSRSDAMSGHRSKAFSEVAQGDTST